MSIQKFQGPQGIWLEIDLADSATPALVCCKIKGELMTSTYDCAIDCGVIDDALELNQAQIKWLESQSDRVEQAIETARKDDPAYN